MRSTATVLTLLLIALGAGPVAAQERLTLDAAVHRALAHNPAVRAADAGVGEAAARTTQARSGYLPRLSLVETAQRGNQPVFAFSSLLAARQFTASDFRLDALNNPDPVTSFHTGLVVDQPIFDGFRTSAALRVADLSRQVAESQGTQTREDLVLAVTRAYGQVVQAAAGRRAAEAAVQASEEDVARAERRRDAGLATEADVLALRVQLAEMRERQIREASDETVARAQLNQAMGESLDQEYVLEEVAPTSASTASVADLEREALSARPELKAVQLQESLARESQRLARSSFYPTLSFQGYFDLNSNVVAFANRASAWMVGAQLQWNLFSGLADVGRLREAGYAAARAGADRERIETAVRVDVRTALARVQAAAARQQVGQAAVAQARESQRIIRDRYDAGMASVNDVLRAANALLDAESQQIAAGVDLLVSNAMLERALGRTASVSGP